MRIYRLNRKITRAFYDIVPISGRRLTTAKYNTHDGVM